MAVHRKKRTGLVFVHPQSDKPIGTLILGLFIVLGIISAVEAQTGPLCTLPWPAKLLSAAVVIGAVFAAVHRLLGAVFKTR